MTTPHSTPSFRSAPIALRRRDVRFNNIALVPANLLPFRRAWQTLANHLPQGVVLFVVPQRESPAKQGMRSIAAAFRARGHGIAAISSDDLV